ncbi:MAG: hypothetical protein KJZ92_14260 [Rhodocyclaceae bacterium]|nr:hypothetical protein [Rhodocyclaceae bacterium]
MNKKSLLFECTINKLKISNNNSTRKYYESIKDIDSKTIGARKNATNESEEKIQEVWKLNKECTEVIFRIRRILKTKKTNDETIEQSCSMP